MSDVSAITGYGFSVEDLSPEKVLLFALKHKDAIKGRYEDLDKVLDFYDFYSDKLNEKTDEEILKIISSDKEQYSVVLEETEDWCSGMPGYGSIPATVISKETGVRVGYEADDNQEVVIFYSCMPWDMNEKEMELKSQDDLKNIMKKYMMELDIPEKYFGYYNLVIYC